MCLFCVLQFVHVKKAEMRFKHNPLLAANQMVNELLHRVHMFVNLIVIKSVPHQLLTCCEGNLCTSVSQLVGRGTVFNGTRLCGHFSRGNLMI